MGKYTRRQFITSAGVGMAAVAGLGLAGCAPQTPADKAMANTGNGGTTFADTIAWDGEYDVVVIGFGGAGAVSACYAADAGAKVLLIDKAPQGMVLPPMYFPPFTPMIHNRSRQPAPAGYANVFPPLSAPPPNLSRNARASRARALSEPG